MTRPSMKVSTRADRYTRSLRMLICLLGIIIFAVPATAQETPTTENATVAPLILILDASGSMWGQVDGENKIVIARRTLGDLVDQLPSDGELALIAYGHRREGDCEDIETLIPLGPLDAAATKTAVGGLNPKGKTPITASVEQALGIVRESGQPATLVLLSDGLETCGGDPCKAVRLAKEAGLPLVLHVVGFDVAGEDLSQLQCMAQAGDGLFLSAADADELGAALETAVAMTVDTPAGRLVVHAVRNGELQDVAINVEEASGKQVAGARTYSSAETNPRTLPLADGTYAVRVAAVGIEGDREHAFEIEIVDGDTVEKSFDFSTGELSIGVTRNGELSDATFRVLIAGTSQQVAGGRTYKKASTNPRTVTLTPGSYEVSIASVDLDDKPKVDLGRVDIEPQGSHSLQHAFESGTLSIGARHGEERVDAVVSVVDPATGKSVVQGRTYTRAKTNPKVFELQPGRYVVRAKAVGKNKGEKEGEVTVDAGGQAVVDFDFGQ